MHKKVALVSETMSPLGRGPHKAATDRRIRGGLDGAYRIGQKRYLTPEAIEEEQQREPTPRPPRGKLDPLQREMVGGLKKIEHVK